MGENDVAEVKTAAAPVVAAPVAAASDKPIVKAVPAKDEKKNKKPVAKPEAVPHITGRLLLVEVSAKGVEFALKGKKGKAEVFSLKGMDAAVIPAAAALLANLIESKSKLRVEYTTSGDIRTVIKIRAHS